MKFELAVTKQENSVLPDGWYTWGNNVMQMPSALNECLELPGIPHIFSESWSKDKRLLSITKISSFYV